MTLTDEQLRTLRHMLGIDQPYVRRPEPYRNYFCANRGDEELAELERLGAVERYAQHSGYDWYRCTPAGEALARSSHRVFRKPKAQRVYHQFLVYSDVCPDLTFREFLTSPKFARARREA